MKLETDLGTFDNVTAAQLRDTLAGIDGKENTRAILSSSERNYLQTAWFDNGFVVERRDGGGDETHFHAIPRHSELPAPLPAPKRSFFQRLFFSNSYLTSKNAFRRDEVQQIFLAYLEGRDSNVPARWEHGFCDE